MLLEQGDVGWHKMQSVFALVRMWGGGVPLAYAAWTLMHGALTGFYPYPFLQVGILGYEHVLRNMAILLVVFGGLGLLLVALDRWLGTRAAPRIESGA